MLKFEYHHLDNTLFIQSPGSPPQPTTNTFSGNYNAQGFILEPANHWITFTIYPNKIRAFYKQVIIPSQESLWSLEQINYYQKDLEKKEIISFTFEPTDEVHKVNNQWVKKYDQKITYLALGILTGLILTYAYPKWKNNA